MQVYQEWKYKSEKKTVTRNQINLTQDLQLIMVL